MTLLFDELRRLLINSGSPGQAGPFDKDGRLLVNDSHKSTSTRNVAGDVVAGDDAYNWATEGNDEVKVPRPKLPGRHNHSSRRRPSSHGGPSQSRTPAQSISRGASPSYAHCSPQLYPIG